MRYALKEPRTALFIEWPLRNSAISLDIQT